jgi:hypothetical protein
MSLTIQLRTSLHPEVAQITTTPKLLLALLFPLIVSSSQGCIDFPPLQTSNENQ